jgi:hypothetical protein
MSYKASSRLRAAALGSALLVWPLMASASPWFGQTLPPPVNDPTGDIVDPTNDLLPPQPAVFGPGPKSSLLDGDKIKADVKTIIDFSLKSKASGDYLWGRVTGTPAYYDTVSWVVDELKAAGVKDAHLEDFTTTLTIPTAGELRILGDTAYGDGSADVVLQSAMVGGRGPVNGTLTAPMIYVGHATQADLLGRDIKGKIAVLHTTPNPGIYSTDENGRVGELIKAGAAGVIEILDQVGNMQSYDADRHGCGTGFCFTIGGADGFFLENMLGKAGEAGKTISARLSSTAREQTGLKAANGVATIPGKTDQTIIINAHADAWFVGGDDNGGGLAVGMALMRYFATHHKLNHTLVFVASAGHHTQGRGVPEFRTVHDGDYVKNARLIINLEHVAGSGLTRSAVEQNHDNFGRKMDWATTDTPMSVAVTNKAPFLMDIWRDGVKCFGLSTQRVIDNRATGEPGGYKDVTTVPITQMISGNMLYHTTGETLASVPAPGLERAARFYAYLIEKADKAPDAMLQGAPSAPSKSCPLTP